MVRQVRHGVREKPQKTLRRTLLLGSLPPAGSPSSGEAGQPLRGRGERASEHLGGDDGFPELPPGLDRRRLHSSE
jgi:hypothetical protein